MNSDNLSLATMDELITEIQKRSIHSAMAIEFDVKVNNEETETRYAYHGGYSGALGLVVRMKRHLLRSLR